MRFISCLVLCMLCSLLISAEERPWLGITLETTGDFDARVVIRSVKDHSTASEIGLRVGDTLTDIGKDKVTWPIKGIDDIKDALSKISVGDEIRVGIERDAQAQTLKGIVKARPSAGGIKNQEKEMNDKIKQIMDLKEKSNVNGALALSLHQLGKTLDQLPEKIEEAAREFKEVYPEGEFVIKVEISIRSSKEDESKEGAEEKDEEEKSEPKKEAAEEKEPNEEGAKKVESEKSKDAPKEAAQP